MRYSEVDFICQMGFPRSSASHTLYTALMLQPRIIGGLFAIGVLLQSPSFFLALSAALWWSALVPTRNPFDAIYNYAAAYPRGLALIPMAPTPRRFAMGEAAAFTLAIAAALFLHATITARMLEGVFVAALMLVFFGRFCLGAYMYHLVRGVMLTGERRVFIGLPCGS